MAKIAIFTGAHQEIQYASRIIGAWTGNENFITNVGIPAAAVFNFAESIISAGGVISTSTAVDFRSFCRSPLRRGKP